MTVFLRKKQVAARLGVHPASIDRFLSDPDYQHLAFPKPVKISPNAVGWVEAEIEGYQQRRIKERDEAPSRMKGRVPPGRTQAAA